MPNWIESFCTGALLLTLISQSLPTTGNTKAAKAAIKNNNITLSQVQQKSLTRRIEIDLSEQRLKAWEGKKLIYSLRTSTGKRSTPTPVGRFRINAKYRTHRMRGRNYDLPKVPYAMYFYKGYAIHGAYWHQRFGTPVSHGCVNLPVKQAQKLYNWTRPGTLVVVRQ